MEATKTAPKPIQLTNAARAAIIITSLGIDEAAAIFKNLSENEVEDITKAAAELDDVTEDVRSQILAEFTEQLRRSAPTDDRLDMPALLFKSIGKKKAEPLLSRIHAAKQGLLFQCLNDLEIKQIATVLQQERPQTLALIFSHLDPKRAAQILAAFEAELQTEIIFCMGRMDRIDVSVATKLDAVLRKKLTGVARLSTLGGAKSIAQVLNCVDRGTGKRLVESLTSKDEQLVNDVKRLMLLFEDLVSLPDKGIQNILREVDMNDLTLALKGAKPEMKNLIYRNLSKRAAERLAEEGDLMGPKARSEVEAAQQRIVAVVRRLEEEGKLTISAGGGGSDELVA